MKAAISAPCKFSARARDPAERGCPFPWVLVCRDGEVTFMLVTKRAFHLLA